MHRLALGRIPRVLRTEQVLTPPSPPLPRGWVFAENAAGQAAYLDVVGGRVGRWDPVTRSPLDALPVDTRQDPLTPGTLALDAAGTHALFSRCGSAHGDPSLCEADFEGAVIRTRYALGGPGWLAGAYVPGGICVLAQRLGPACRFSVHKLSRPLALDGAWRDEEIWRCEGAQPPVLPLALSAELWWVVVCPQPDPWTGTGPTSLCALDVPSGTLTPLCPAEGHALRAVGEAIEVVGPAFTTRVTLG